MGSILKLCPQMLEGKRISSVDSAPRVPLPRIFEQRRILFPDIVFTLREAIIFFRGIARNEPRW